MASLKEIILVIDEAYLTGIANRGMVNRAKKELDGSGIIITLTDSTLEADFTDGVRTIITDKPANFKCSCPSRSICKHALMALLQASREAAAENIGDSNTATENTSGIVEDTPEDKRSASTDSATVEQLKCKVNENNFSYLLEYDQMKLVKEFGKTVYNDALSKISSGAQCEFEEASILIASIMDGAFTIRFLPNASLDESICSCKMKTCAHRAEAILQYLKHKTGKITFDLTPDESKADVNIIPRLIYFIEEIFRVGLFRLNDNYSERCSQLATLCHGAGFADFEKMFETSGRELALYEQKSARFNKNVLIRNLSRIYQICGEITRGGNLQVLAGSFKRRYLEMPKLYLIGLGAYSWYAQSGYCGVTAVFYAPSIKRRLNFSEVQQAASEAEAATVIERIWRSKSAWNLPVSFGAIAKSALSLDGGKISEDGRLSSSENAVATLEKSQTNLEDLENEKKEIIFDDFSQIKNLFSIDPNAPRTVYAILRLASFQDGGFDRVTQTYTVSAGDHSGGRISIVIRYSKTTETTILNCEYLERAKITPNALTVNVIITGERFEATAFPLAVWLPEGIKNLGEEKLFSNDVDEEYNYKKYFEAIELDQPKNQSEQDFSQFFEEGGDGSGF